MKIFITGGTGFVGRQLTKALIRRGHQLTILSRSAKSIQDNNSEIVVGNPTKPGPWQEMMKKHDAVINLAGAPIFCRWTEKNRQMIMDSRVLTTRNIVKALGDKDAKVKVLLNGSAIGYYGDKADLKIDEGTPPGSSFLAKVAGNWENEALAAPRSSVRVVCCRLGVVLGRSGGALSKMLPPFKAGLGSSFGHGRQWFSWIHLDDLTEAFCFILEHEDIMGPINLTAPTPVTNQNFSRLLAHSLNRPFFMPPIPTPLLRLCMGEAADLILDSARVIPAILMNKKFTFMFADIESALANLLGR